MKSPWKFLIDLASRGRAVEQPPRVPEAVENPHAPPMPTGDTILAATPDETEEIDKAAPVAVETGPAAGENAWVGVESVDDETSPVAREPAQTMEAVAATRPKPSKQRAGRKSKVQNVALASGVAYGTANSKPRVPPISFADEAVALDEDIRHLRRQLARKLSLQNAQLKKMLERF